MKNSISISKNLNRLESSLMVEKNDVRSPPNGFGY
jgi:hypothetical protein